MKKEFTELGVGERLVITVSSNNGSIEFSAEIIKHLKSNIALINISDNIDKVLNFKGTDITIVYTTEDDITYAWFKCTIVYYQGHYLLQVPENGGQRYNRRNSFRVGIAQTAKLKVNGHREKNVIIENISLTGFSITDTKKELNLECGTHVTLRYEDLGHELLLDGNVVRIHEEDNYTVYGFVITKSCRDLASYITEKQRSKK